MTSETIIATEDAQQRRVRPPVERWILVGMLVLAALVSFGANAYLSSAAVDATAGGGLTGDRYGAAVGTYSGQRRPDHERGVTLIAAEAVASTHCHATLVVELIQIEPTE